MKKVKIENIVFLQGDDYTQMENELNESDSPDSCVWLSEEKVIEYLFQWYFPGEHGEDIYNAEDINTAFLGYERKIDNDIFLFSHNTSLGYAGLSRIVEYIEE